MYIVKAYIMRAVLQPQRFNKILGM